MHEQSDTISHENSNEKPDLNLSDLNPHKQVQTNG